MDKGIKNTVDRIIKLKRFIPGMPVILFCALLVWIFSGFFTVGPDEIGIVKTFGRQARQEKPGLHYHLPWPISEALTPKIKKIYSLEIGPPDTAFDDVIPNQTRPKANLLLTGDRNLIQVGFTLQYRIKDPQAYSFRSEKPEVMIEAAARAAMSETIGGLKLDEALTTERGKTEKAVKTNLQSAMEAYELGISITAVQLQGVQPPVTVRDSFKAALSAQEEKIKIINEAQSYATDIQLMAQGKAAATISEAEAYREDKLNRAKGEAARFIAIYQVYKKSRDVTKQRIYLEEMEKVLSRAGKVILEPRERTVLPYYNLNNADVPRTPLPEVKKETENP